MVGVHAIADSIKNKIPNKTNGTTWIIDVRLELHFKKAGRGRWLVIDPSESVVHFGDTVLVAPSSGQLQIPLFFANKSIAVSVKFCCCFYTAIKVVLTIFSAPKYREWPTRIWGIRNRSHTRGDLENEVRWSGILETCSAHTPYTPNTHTPYTPYLGAFEIPS